MQTEREGLKLGPLSDVMKDTIYFLATGGNGFFLLEQLRGGKEINNPTYDSEVTRAVAEYFHANPDISLTDMSHELARLIPERMKQQVYNSIYH